MELNCANSKVIQSLGPKKEDMLRQNDLFKI
jgi:hypothetical protein